MKESLRISKDRVRVNKESWNEKTIIIKREENQVQNRSYSLYEERLRSSAVHESGSSLSWQMIDTEL